jgi:hypothetical protein
MKFKKFIFLFLEDILVLAGCICILIGLSLWSAVATWIAGGLMLIGFGVMFAMGKLKMKNDPR